MKVSAFLWPGIISAMVGLGIPAFAQSDQNAYQPPPSARKLAEDGLALFKSGEYENAASLLRQAQSQFDAPQYRLYIGRSYEKLGKLVEACEEFAAAGAMKPPADAPEDFRRKFEKATSLALEDLASVTRLIPTVRLAVSGPPPGSVRVSAAGAALRVSSDGEALRAQMNAGELDIRIEAPGFAPVTVHVKAKLRSAETAIETLTIALAAVPAKEPIRQPTSVQSTTPNASPLAVPEGAAGAPGTRAEKDVPPTETFSHRMQVGVYARGDFQVTHGGAVAVLGISFAVHDFVEPYVGALLGRDVGVEPGVCAYFLRGPLKPRLDVAVPIFFEDSAYAGVRASGGVQWDPFRSFGLFAQAGGAFFPVVPGGYNQFVFLPSVGVQGRL